MSKIIHMKVELQEKGYVVMESVYSNQEGPRIIKIDG